MDIEELASDFGATKKKPKEEDHGIDIHGLAKEFGPTVNDEGKPLKRVYITPKPPISGASEEQSNEINAQPETKGGANPRDSQLAEGIKNLPSNIYEEGKQNFKDAGSTLQSGMGDIAQGKFGSGSGKVGIGLLQGLTAAPSAVIDNTVTKPVTQLTGNPDIGDRAGFVASAAIPVVPGASAVVNAIPKNVALKNLVQHITSDGQNPGALREVVDAMKADNRIGPADKSPSVMSATQKLFTREGSATKNYLFNTSSQRLNNLGSDIKEAFDAAGGTPVHIVNKLNDLAEAAKKAGSEKINPALAAAKPVDVSNTVSSINDILKPGVNSIVSTESALPLVGVKKELANIKQYLASDAEMRTNAKDLHSFQSGLRRTAESLLKSSDGGSRELGKALMNVRNNLVNDIEKSAPGYKNGLSSYRDEMHIADAFRDSYNGVFSNSTKMENRPEFTEKWFNGLTDHEKEAAREGARLAIDSKMGASQNGSLAGTNLGRSDFNQAKLEILFGKEKTEELLRNLENTRSIKNTHNKIIEGSQTGMRTAEDAAIDLPEKPKSGIARYIVPAMAAAGEAANSYVGSGIPGLGLAASLAASGVGKVGSEVKHAIETKLAKERNLKYAKYALPTEGPERDALIQSLDAIANKPKRSLLSKLSSNVIIPP